MISTFNAKLSIGSRTFKEERERIKTKRILLITSKTPYKLLKEQVQGLKPLFAGENTSEDVKRLAQSKNVRDAELIIALGAGTVIDTAKVIASINKTELIAVPSVLSSNVFATNKSVIREGTEVKTIHSKIPDQVIVDFDLIRKAEKRYNLSGIADVLSIATALYDWKIAIRERKESEDKAVINVAESLLKTVLEEYPKICTADDEGLKLLAECLLFSGYLTNLYGSGRPESGSEHMFSRAVEEDARYHDKILHGESVMLGILLASELQGQRNESFYKIATRMDILGLLKRTSLSREDMAGFFVIK